MPRLTLAAALAALLLPPAAPLFADDPPKTQDKQLDGDWEWASAVENGKKAPTPPDNPLLSFKGDTLTTKIVNVETAGVKSSVKVDASKTPKAIDLTPLDGPDKGKTSLGIYEIKGDELRLCTAEAGKDRPTEFSAKEGSGQILTVLKRVKK